MSESKPQSEVRAPLTFIVRQDTKPYFKSSALTGGVPEIFFETESRTVAIHDMRTRTDDLDLDRDGFVLRRIPTNVDDLYDDDALVRVYDREIEAMLTAELGADRVVVFDRTRRSDASDGAANPDGARGPADRVHVDYTVASGPTGPATCSAPTRSSVSSRAAGASSRSTSGGRSRARWNARPWRSPPPIRSRGTR